MPSFLEHLPTLDNYWRSLILFGDNSASYKFALAKTLLKLAPSHDEFFTLEELADPFSQFVCEHLLLSDKQGTSPSSKFLDSCRQYNRDDLTRESLISTTVKYGFKDVLDAFHTLHREHIGTSFFIDERRSPKKGIRITQKMMELADNYHPENLNSEIESRWRLVETAWQLEIPTNSLVVDYDLNTKELVFNQRHQRRKSITRCRPALNGYQKGKCFYCFGDISILPHSNNLAEVDHFFPRRLGSETIGANIDGVWNLVLACSDCNRGEDGKKTKIPELVYLERLHIRNNYLYRSYKPLRETLDNLCGNSKRKRHQFLCSIYEVAIRSTPNPWKPKHEYEPAF